MLPSNRIDKPKALSLLLHTADISHPSKPWALHSRWTKALMEEFFQQVGTLKDATLAFVSSSQLSHQWLALYRVSEAETH